MAPSSRPDMQHYFMGIALAVRRRADCLGSRVGALLVQDRRIVSTGYNGTPERVANCTEGGCLRCAHADRYPAGSGYDLCICVHAEQNALLAAARFGIAVEGAMLYTTMRPCFGCTKELLQARVAGVRYLHEWQPGDAERREQYHRLQACFAEGVQQLTMDDPDAAWAVRSAREPSLPDETGHEPS